MNWRKILLALGQVGTLLVPYAIELGERLLEGRRNKNDEAEQEQYLAQALSEQQEELAVEIEMVAKLVRERCPDNRDAKRYIARALAFLPQGLDGRVGQLPVTDSLSISLSAREVFKVRLADLPLAFRYVDMAREIANEAGSGEGEI